MKSRIYYMMLAVITAAFLTACDNTDTTESGDLNSPATGSSGGVGTENMESDPAVNDLDTENYPESEIPTNIDPQDPGSTSNTDPNATNTNP